MPGYRADTGYDLCLLPKDGVSRRAAGLPAQLAAVLCGQADKFASTFHGEQAFCRADAEVTVADTSVQLHLRQVELQTLADADNDLQALLCAELQSAFAALTDSQPADFFHLQFWHENLYGTGSIPPAPTLEIIFE